MRKKNKILLLSFVLIINGMVLTSSIFKDNRTKSDIHEDKQGTENLHFKNLKNSDYSSNYQGNGEKVNITLQQSLLNNSIISFPDLEISNTFTEPCPTVDNFNSSFINILIENLKADNMSLIVQNNPNDGEIDCATTRLSSFSASANCYIINASINIKRTASPTGDIYLYASSWNSVLNRSEPTGIPTTIGTIAPTANGWLYIDLIDTFLNNSNTDNKTWFFGVVRTSGGGSIQWRYTDDTVANNNSYAYYSNAGWTYEPRDYLLEIGLAPISAAPYPQAIGLNINNTQVVDYGVASGYWTSIEELQDSSGILSFTITSDWNALSLNITEVQINYTKTDLQASSEFSVLKGESKISWNVSRSNGFNYFDPRINNYTTINFTIPTNWNDINVFNSTVNKTNNILIRNLNNAYKEVQLFSAGNGNFWFLNATSSNLLQSIDTYENSNPKTTFNYSSIIHFNATFSKKIAQNDGIINLSVYNPATINDKLNFTEIYTLFGPSSEISLGDWDVSDNITQYGIFRAQISWNNDTDAGFLEKNITIIGETDLMLIKPLQNALFNSDQIFNITVYFYDSGLNQSVDGTLWYSINSGIWQSTINNNGTTGYYNITIDCSMLYPYGPQIVSLSLNQTYYYNKSLDYNFSVIGVSDLALISPAQNSVFTPDQSFNITVYYNDTTNNQPINGTMWYNINSGAWQSTTNQNGTAGYFNITINCNKLDPYGPQSVLISLNHTFYQNKTLDYNFKVICLTELNITYPSQFINKLSDELFNITIYFYETNKYLGIEGANISYNVNGTIYNNVYEVGNGYYNITIYNWQVLSDAGYGLIDITINANKTNYFNQTSVFHYYIYNATTQLIDQDTLNVIRSQNVTFTGYYLFNDSTPILGADLQMISINPNFIYTWGDNGDGSYYIELDTTNVLGMGSIPYPIIFNISSRFNQTQIYSVNLFVWNKTDYKVNNLSQINYSYYLNSEPWIIYYGEDVTFNISYFDTDNADKLISGAWGNFTLFNSTKNWDSILIYTDINGFYYFTLNTSDLFTGIYSVKVKLNSTYFNSTINIFQFEIIACNVSANILALNQYGGTINLNNTIYEAYFGDNITINMIFLNSFSNTPIIGGFGNLTFNNQSIYYSDIDKDGIYMWELNSSNLEFGRYSFIVSFNKANFQNHSFEIFFDINRFNININSIEQPYEVARGEVFSITLNITNQFLGEPISNLNISILVDFGTLSWDASNISLSNGLIYFYIFVPNNATVVNITIQFLGDNSFNATEIVFSINIKAEDNGNITDEFLLVAIYVILIIGVVVGSGLFIVYRKKRLSSSEPIAEEELKLLSLMKSEEEFIDSLQEEIVIKKSIETTKEIDNLIKKQVDINNEFKILSLDRLKDKMESNISKFIEKGEEIKELEESELFTEKLDKVGLMEQIEQIELKEFKNSIRKLNNEGLDLLKKGELKKSLEKYKKIRDLLKNYFE